MLLVKTLTALHSQDQATVYGEFERAETGVVLPKQLYFMWPFQKQRMVTHADCIMCDSLWKAEKGGSFLLAVVVVDEHSHALLGAACIAVEEGHDAWCDFFKWIQQRVSTFNPMSIITDGASYIAKAFADATGNTHACHLICWRHRQVEAKRRRGFMGVLRRAILNLAYATEEQEAEFIEHQVKDMIIKLDQPTVYRRMWREFFKQKGTALLRLNCFTAGTMTNSVAESVNHVLRSFGLDARSSVMDVIRSLRAYVISEQAKVAHMTKMLKQTPLRDQLFTPQCLQLVTNRVLCHVMDKAKQALRECSLVGVADGADCANQQHDACSERVDDDDGEGNGEHGNSACGQDEDAAVFNACGGDEDGVGDETGTGEQDGAAAAGEEEETTMKVMRHQVMKQAGRCVEIITTSTVRWPTMCSCHHMVISGMPCIHMVFLAAVLKRPLPLQCFSKRFFFINFSFHIFKKG